MKVKFQYGLAGYTGKADGLVFCYHKSRGRVYARKNTYPRLTAENERIGSTTAALFAIKPSQAYINDLRFYRTRYNALRQNYEQPVPSWSALYLRLMYNMAKANPAIDLRTLTHCDIYSQNLPCISVKKAVEAGLLPPVYNYASFNHEI